ncbi:trypsin-like serine protease [Streptomyces sp. NPDC017941]|uniref:trypsin-like serine protease n=1 Tax=Streptomyces sp. NPDC017941 TaxID=3365018 RepID=UPI0037B4A32D
MRLSFPYRRPRAVRAVLAAATATTALALVAANAPAANAVIGGTEVPNDAYPFTVAVLDKGPGSVKDRQFCGGSLVAPDTVMTAAHCLVDDRRKPVKPKAVQTAVGRTVLSRAGQGRIRDVAEDGILVHPRYLRGKDAYDLAFIKLSKPVRGPSRPATPPSPRRSAPAADRRARCGGRTPRSCA